MSLTITDGISPPYVSPYLSLQLFWHWCESHYLSLMVFLHPTFHPTSPYICPCTGVSLTITDCISPPYVSPYLSLQLFWHWCESHYLSLMVFLHPTFHPTSPYICPCTGVSLTITDCISPPYVSPYLSLQLSLHWCESHHPCRINDQPVTCLSTEDLTVRAVIFCCRDQTFCSQAP